MGIINAKLRILDKVDNTSDNSKNVNSAEFPAGFLKRDMTAKWGNQDGILITNWETANVGDIQFRENNSSLNVLIDGVFYQNEGENLVLDSENFVNYAAAKDHTHDYIPLSGSANLTGYFFPAEHDQVMLGNPNKAFSQVFAVDFKVVNTDNNTTRLALGSYGADGFKYSQPAILFWFIPDGGGLKQLTLRTEEITQSRTLKLPDKSGTLTTNTTVSDWNEAITSGFYVSAAGASNAPVSNVGIAGNVFAIGNMIVQTVYPEETYNVDITSYTRKGVKNGSSITWSNWVKHYIEKTYTIKGYIGKPSYKNLFNQLIPDTVTSIYFTNTFMPSNATLIDVDDDGDGGVVAWVDTNDNTKMYVSTQYKGVKVEGNTNSSNMFYYCRNLVTLDLSNFDTSKINNMSSMFNGCNSLTSLDVSEFDTSNVTDMCYMFTECNELTELNIAKWDTHNVTNMGSMFNGCSKITSLNVSNFDTSNVTSMYMMFSKCSIKELDLINFNTTECTNFQGMFFSCNKLTSLDLSSFDTNNAQYMQGMFQNCASLISIKVGNKFKWISPLSELGLSGTWKDETGTTYSSSSTFPSNVAHTYTKVS